MRWAIKHKSGRTLFVTSDEFIASNRKEMGWIVEELKMTSREKFEEWAKENGMSLAYGDCDYVYSPTVWAWKAWQASCASIEVATPWLCGDGDNDTEWTQGYNDGVMATEKAIISAGLKVKK
jgi:hypothetical protein